MLYPIIPDTTLKVLKIFNLKDTDIVFSSISDHDFLKPDSKINSIDILFKKVEK